MARHRLRELTAERVASSPWHRTPLELWNDWRWQLKHRLTTLEDLERVCQLSSEEKAGVAAANGLRLRITPYVATLMDPVDPRCPLRRQFIPVRREQETFEGMMSDSLGEDAFSPVPGLVHRFPDRVLMLVATHCASYCRFCTRSRIVGGSKNSFARADYERQLEYLRNTPRVRDVLVSGGEPLLLAPRVLQRLLRRLREIPHIEILRIGTRVPALLPQRITDELVGMLREHHPLWINVHFNHPKEITPEARFACEKLADAGIPVGNQSVLLAGINDCPNIQRELCHALVQMRVRPYYLYQCDLVVGAGHFRTPVTKGLEIMEALRGHTSGMAVPTYVIDAPEDGSKVPLSPNYLLSMSPKQVVVRNFEGRSSTYAQPLDYEEHDSASCACCQRARREQRRADVVGLAGTQRLPPESPVQRATLDATACPSRQAESRSDSRAPIWTKIH